MKKIIYSIVIMALCLALCSCQISDDENIETGFNIETTSEDYTTQFVKKLNWLGVLINNPNTLDDEYKMHNWYVDHMILPDKETMVSLYEIKVKTHLYNLSTESDLILKDYDLTDLYLNKSPKQDEFEDFCIWYFNSNGREPKSGSEIYDIYVEGMATGYRLYRESNGHEFKDKDIWYLTAEEELELEQWIKENPDYSTAGEDYEYEFLLNLLGVANLTAAPTEAPSIYDEFYDFY